MIVFGLRNKTDGYVVENWLPVALELALRSELLTLMLGTEKKIFLPLAYDCFCF